MFRGRFTVFGSVQGVGYRMFVKRIALMMHLNGYVRNMMDGTVEVVVESGTKEVLADFKNRIHKRATAASFDDITVDKIDADIQETKAPEFKSFETKI